MSTTAKRSHALAAAVALSLVLAACGSSSGNEDPATSDTANNETPVEDESATDAPASDPPASDAPADEATVEDTTSTSSSDEPTASEADTESSELIRVRETSQGSLLETGDGLTIYANFTDLLRDETGCPGAGPDLCGAFVPLLSPTGDLVADGLDPEQYTLVENASGMQIAVTISVDDGLPLYTWSDEGPGEYNGVRFGSPFGRDWFPVADDGKLQNSFDAELE